MNKVILFCLLLTGCATAHVVGVVLPTKPVPHKCGTYTKLDVKKPITTQDVKLAFTKTKVTLESCQDYYDALMKWVDNLYDSAK